MMKWMALPLVVLALIITGCASKKGGSGSSGSRYSIKNDHGPSAPVDVSHVKDAVPIDEPKSRGGNRSPYTVLGRSYSILDDSSGYRERGGASWYGNKFHGHLTSNGETYDMYKMSAAHKSLPIPTYVRVTNLDNGKQVIVRVNDRGPFHSGRIIDLSYAAASKLGMLARGTARVEVEAINPRAWQSASRAIAAPPSSDVSTARAVPVALSSGSFVQVGAYSQAGSANRIARQLSDLYGRPSKVTDVERSGRTLYRVLLGPFVSKDAMERMIYQLSQSGYPGAHPVDFP
jgi:rare lipoprotein A